MDFTFVQDPQFFSLVILPLLIFFARVADVTFGTLRIIFISRGMKLLAPVVAFFEILIWLVAIGQIFQDIGSIVNILAYSAGFAVGNFVGILVEERMAIGLNLIRIITQYDAEDLISALKSGGYGVTAVDGAGKHGPVKLIFLVVKRKDIEEVIGMVQHFNPNAFYTIADVRSAKGGDIPHLYRKPRKRRFGQARKEK
ncbi:DUF2179 domain-containing protein [Methanogenium sp. S4BF]|uniref:DUF2179 domain-containing protein n=1 Tax=Methanogenium sp. S4BF TaxID=1789226 RepID=UPI002415D903|nr:DUF2179 domain-containing protein [Methanogenium sp. S4BF]WFN33912.1 DUF2179 domain-containing protein [Methanogenium sp. S4BF]